MCNAGGHWHCTPWRHCSTTPAAPMCLCRLRCATWCTALRTGISDTACSGTAPLVTADRQAPSYLWRCQGRPCSSCVALPLHVRRKAGRVPYRICQGLALLERTSKARSQILIRSILMWWQGSRLVVRALRDLAPGTELLHCYGPQAGEYVTPLRRQLLHQQYHFHCMCVPCRALTLTRLVF